MTNESTQIEIKHKSDGSSVFIGEGYDEKNYYSSFHLDYDASDNADVIHPWFHFTYGGHNLKEEETGNVLLLTSPRLPYMPMDFFLGIDFILSNFLEKTRNLQNVET